MSIHPPPAERIAAIVLDAGRAVGDRRRVRRRGGIALSSASPAGIVLGERRPRSSATSIAALAAAATLHAGLGWGLSPDGDRRPRPAPPPARRLHLEAVVELDPPAAPPAQPLTPPAPESRPRREPRRRAPAATPAAPAATPSEAPPVAAAPSGAEPAPVDEIVDLTGGAGDAGDAGRYRGGVSASSMSPPGSAGHAGTSRTGDARSQARPVALDVRQWSCPWPRQADALSIDEEVVVIRVVVRGDGSVASAELVADPGHGFGDAALDCARRHRFRPAAGRDGRAMVATSPPIRITFTR